MSHFYNFQSYSITYYTIIKGNPKNYPYDAKNCTYFKFNIFHIVHFKF